MAGPSRRCRPTCLTTDWATCSVSGYSYPSWPTGSPSQTIPLPSSPVSSRLQVGGKYFSVLHSHCSIPMQCNVLMQTSRFYSACSNRAGGLAGREKWFPGPPRPQLVLYRQLSLFAGSSHHNHYKVNNISISQYLAIRFMFHVPMSTYILLCLDQ